MLNTIKMDLYKMVKSKSSFIILFVLFCIITFSTSIMGLSIDKKLVVDMSEAFNVLNQTSEFCGGGGGAILFLSIFTVIYSNSMYKSGYIKNIVGKVSTRRDLIVSNIIMILIYALLVFLITFIGITIGGFIGFEHVKFIGIKEFLIAGILQYILMVALMMGVLLIITLLRKSGGVMAITIIYISGIGFNLWHMLDLLVKRFISSTIDIMDYSIICNLTKVKMTSNINFDNYWKPLIIAVVWASIFIAGSIFVMNKKDIA